MSRSFFKKKEKKNIVRRTSGTHTYARTYTHARAHTISVAHTHTPSNTHEHAGFNSWVVDWMFSGVLLETWPCCLEPVTSVSVHLCINYYARDVIMQRLKLSPLKKKKILQLANNDEVLTWDATGPDVQSVRLLLCDNNRACVSLHEWPVCCCQIAQREHTSWAKKHNFSSFFSQKLQYLKLCSWHNWMIRHNQWPKLPPRRAAVGSERSSSSRTLHAFFFLFGHNKTPLQFTKEPCNSTASSLISSVYSTTCFLDLAVCNIISMLSSVTHISLSLLIAWLRMQSGHFQARLTS